MMKTIVSSFLVLVFATLTASVKAETDDIAVRIHVNKDNQVSEDKCSLNDFFQITSVVNQVQAAMDAAEDESSSSSSRRRNLKAGPWWCNRYCADFDPGTCVIAYRACKGYRRRVLSALRDVKMQRMNVEDKADQGSVISHQQRARKLATEYEKVQKYCEKKEKEIEKTIEKLVDWKSMENKECKKNLLEYIIDLACFDPSKLPEKEPSPPDIPPFDDLVID